MSKRDQRQIEWVEQIAAFKASGLTKAVWCNANQVTLEQLKYWARKL